MAAELLFLEASKEVVGNWAEEGGGEDAILLFSESLHRVRPTLGARAQLGTTIKLICALISLTRPGGHPLPIGWGEGQGEGSSEILHT
ncbi:MAG: hypothetical protein DME23_09415 [Verrucomicrobia bacterium]|nr:MAG: hypothetical protein DME23_09415 [Verrucomicrobiota bacterium]